MHICIYTASEPYDDADRWRVLTRRTPLVCALKGYAWDRVARIMINSLFVDIFREQFEMIGYLKHQVKIE